jgi:hypothetical protein
LCHRPGAERNDGRNDKKSQLQHVFSSVADAARSCWRVIGAERQ